MNRRQCGLSEDLFQEGRGTLPIDLGVEEFFDHIRLINEADDAHLSLAFGTNKRVCFIDFSNEVGRVLF